MRSFLFVTITIASFMVSVSYASQFNTQETRSSLAGVPVKARLRGVSKLHRRRCNKSTSTGSVDTSDNRKEDKIAIDASCYINYKNQ
ncbi:hypothetical protein EDC94DRAFT_217261 [Helicostylum pulchrum]|nr:hypothetical protein EDC94DRAFT_217261 [Helicostylum pulchrum]